MDRCVPVDMLSNTRSFMLSIKECDSCGRGAQKRRRACELDPLAPNGQHVGKQRGSGRSGA